MLDDACALLQRRQRRVKSLVTLRERAALAAEPPAEAEPAAALVFYVGASVGYSSFHGCAIHRLNDDGATVDILVPGVGVKKRVPRSQLRRYVENPDVLLLLHFMRILFFLTNRRAPPNILCGLPPAQRGGVWAYADARGARPRRRGREGEFILFTVHCVRILLTI